MAAAAGTPTEAAAATTPASADARLLQLIWLASPALPVGGFSYSEGLEAAVDQGRVRDEAGARSWLVDQLHLGLARCELPLLAQALAAWRADDRARIEALNTWMLTTRESAELRLQTEQMGRSLAEWMRHGPQAEDPRLAALRALQPAPTWPVAYALAAADGGAAAREVLLSYGFGWAENMTQAAMKAVPLGQIAGQRILRALAEALVSEIDAALAREPQAHTPMLALLSAHHEAQYSRLFRS